MSTAQELVTDAYGMLGVLDLNELAPSATEMTKGLRVLSQMIASWQADGLTLADVSVTGTVDGSTAVITSISDTSRLAPGMNVTGTGVSGRIFSIDDINRTITMDAVTTIAGSNRTLACVAMPFEAKFENGVAALLAMELAPMAGEDNIPAQVQRMAQNGWSALQANYFRPGRVSFDPMLTQTSMRRTTVLNQNG